MKYTRIPENTFKNIQLNAGIIVKDFNPVTQVVNGLLGATTGGVTFTAEPTFEDFGEDIDNCPKNTMELKKLTEWGVTLEGDFVTVTAETAKKLIASADVDPLNESHIIPRNDVLLTDFEDLWWIGDYSDVNNGDNAGYIAIHMLNALNTGGFSLTSSDKGKGQFGFSFEGHYSMNAQDTVPFEVYVVGGESTETPSVLLDKHALRMAVDDTYALTATTIPSDASVTYSSSNAEVATVSNGTITAVGAGNAIITATITVDYVDYTDTCTVVVSE